MMTSHDWKIRREEFKFFVYSFILLSLWPINLWASQEAVVIRDRAVIYSDVEMTSPLGYVLAGKKVLVGEIPRNKAQVYPIVVSGKVAYIKVVDVTTETVSGVDKKLVADRFKRVADPSLGAKFVLSYFKFNSTISVDNTAGDFVNSDPVVWNGISLKSEALLKNKYDAQLLINHLFTHKEDTTFRIWEIGLGGAYRIINKEKFLVRAEAQLMLIPFSTYYYSNDFRVKSYGYSAGGGLTTTYLFGKHWGVEGYAGLYQTKLLGFKVPAPYTNIAPTFLGTRMGVGLNLSY